MPDGEIERMTWVFSNHSKSDSYHHHLQCRSPPLGPLSHSVCQGATVVLRATYTSPSHLADAVLEEKKNEKTYIHLCGRASSSFSPLQPHSTAHYVYG
jgi:hypothetical protein